MDNKEVNSNPPCRGLLSEDRKYWFTGKEWQPLELRFSQEDLENAYKEGYRACYNREGPTLDYCWRNSSTNGKISYTCKK